MGGQRIGQYTLAGTTERKQYCQIICGVRNLRNKSPGPIIGGCFPKFGNGDQSDDLVIKTAFAPKSENRVELAPECVFRISYTP